MRTQRGRRVTPASYGRAFGDTTKNESGTFALQTLGELRGNSDEIKLNIKD